MGWTLLENGSRYLSAGYSYGMGHPELVIVVGLLVYLLLRRRFQACLILTLGIALSFANYFVLVEYGFLAFPLVYSFGFAAVSIVLLVLLVYQFIHTA
ncbi:MAG: hypothetical protein C4532_08870 [Candidatus Abyssobacteria bacterium SURF_17]|uniref:Uncharacterized protein n=1 Tax=Candidatus Abyssobacteria bacterium SURF_17 TaxID=2093361 RepID=A0A419EZI6_9BACT|nr:MAG: hypothetical protein C4532_08870 [Candidatus Abyssubacteria bacterium SURF_17]